ncbi:type II toxin-antitoxin system death-on-curing family toxin [Brachybacterium hainanense]|uniref:Type II toxin-antitoxin system death-on-curing family toxin n=1 Tax=Brachybacterium hainanense TaxID=1541174 RepID=A0ABV6R6V3_9MICO
MTAFLTLEDLLDLILDLGVGPVRDLGLLASAAHRPSTTLFGREAYESLDLKAAVLLESVVRNHPLVDGNRRLGWLAVAVFYDINSTDLDAPDDDAYDLVIGVATGSVTAQESAARLASWRR